jgi:lipopolysaccharide export LptBFGC system permease protein LptF
MVADAKSTSSRRVNSMAFFGVICDALFGLGGGVLLGVLVRTEVLSKTVAYWIVGVVAGWLVLVLAIRLRDRKAAR